jgi:hypothetical protein
VIVDHQNLHARIFMRAVLVRITAFVRMMHQQIIPQYQTKVSPFITQR